MTSVETYKNKYITLLKANGARRKRLKKGNQTMFKILSNLRKTSLSVLAIVILLCIQAWADLELPNYTSKIVNIGIQSRKYTDTYLKLDYKCLE